MNSRQRQTIGHLLGPQNEKFTLGAKRFRKALTVLETAGCVVCPEGPFHVAIPGASAYNGSEDIRGLENVAKSVASRPVDWALRVELLELENESLRQALSDLMARHPYLTTSS